MATVLARVAQIGAKQGGKAVAKKVGKTAVKKAAKAAVKKAVKKGVKKGAKKGAKKAAKKTAKKAGKKAGKKGAKKLKSKLKDKAKKKLKDKVKDSLEESLEDAQESEVDTADESVEDSDEVIGFGEELNSEEFSESLKEQSDDEVDEDTGSNVDSSSLTNLKNKFDKEHKNLGKVKALLGNASDSSENISPISVVVKNNTRKVRIDRNKIAEIVETSDESDMIVETDHTRKSKKDRKGNKKNQDNIENIDSSSDVNISDISEEEETSTENADIMVGKESRKWKKSRTDRKSRNDKSIRQKRKLEEVPSDDSSEDSEEVYDDSFNENDKKPNIKHKKIKKSDPKDKNAVRATYRSSLSTKNRDADEYPESRIGRVSQKRMLYESEDYEESRRPSFLQRLFGRKSRNSGYKQLRQGEGFKDDRNNTEYNPQRWSGKSIDHDISRDLSVKQQCEDILRTHYLSQLEYDNRKHHENPDHYFKSGKIDNSKKSDFENVSKRMLSKGENSRIGTSSRNVKKNNARDNIEGGKISPIDTVLAQTELLNIDHEFNMMLFKVVKNLMMDEYKSIKSKNKRCNEMDDNWLKAFEMVINHDTSKDERAIELEKEKLRCGILPCNEKCYCRNRSKKVDRMVNNSRKLDKLLNPLSSSSCSSESSGGLKDEYAENDRLGDLISVLRGCRVRGERERRKISNRMSPFNDQQPCPCMSYMNPYISPTYYPADAQYSSNYENFDHIPSHELYLPYTEYYSNYDNNWPYYPPY